jgi:hypothetical protein
LFVSRLLPSSRSTHYIHIKDSNEYNTWVIVRSINIVADARIFMKKLLGSISCKNNKY